MLHTSMECLLPLQNGPDWCPAASIGEVAAIRSDLGRARNDSRAWSKGLGEAYRNDAAASFARRALESFAHEVAPRLELRPFPAGGGELDSAAAALAERIGRTAAVLPMEEGLHLVTGLYPLLLAERTRARLGAFYTPPVLAARLLDQATEEGIDWRSARVLDPAAGAGAFLVLAALRMRSVLADCEPVLALEQIGRRLMGLEIDPRAASLAQSAVEVVLSDLMECAGQRLPQVVRVCDALAESPQEAFDLVIGNPPYGRVTLTLEQRRRYSRSLYGHANLYGVFTDAALRWARQGGTIAYLTPTSFLAGQYYAALRRLLANDAPPVTIDLVHARRGVFEDVLQETLLAVYRKGEPARRARIHYLDLVDEGQTRITRNGTIALPAEAGDPWLAPRTPNHARLIARVETMPSRLADWGYSVSTGPLVWNRFKPQLRLRRDGRNVHPLVWAEAVTPDGRFEFRARKRNHAPYFELREGDDWLLVRESCVLVQRTTAKEQARRLIAAELPPEFVDHYEGVVVENHLNMVRANGTAGTPPAVVAALLNSRVVDEIFRCMSGTVAVSAFELEAMPLPSVEDLALLTDLVAQEAERERIEAECRRLYGEPG
jgi:adenine-specific DNA-methyltransferase